MADLLPHLFRTEFRKIVSVLVKGMGVSRIEQAEDIASDTFLQAAESWKLKGNPENPSAWLYVVAKNKARDYLRREQLFQQKISPHLKDAAKPIKPLDLSPQNIQDSQLQMMFALCHPKIPIESQVGLGLRILCGLGIDEIADAFLINKETINKRLYRAREKLRLGQLSLSWPASHEIPQRLDAVLRVIYLMFNEGYHSASPNAILRKDLCLESMRLALLLLTHEPTRLPKVDALMALMCFHASRFEARMGSGNEIVLYKDQNEALWDQDLIEKGNAYLRLAARGEEVSKYHLEAMIAYWHTQKEDGAEKWENILQLYNRLLQIEYSPIAALNRTYALAKAESVEKALLEAEKLGLEDNHYYHVFMAEWLGQGKKQKALLHLRKAHSLAKSPQEKALIQRKIEGWI